VPRLPHVQRVEVDHFDVTWTAARSPVFEEGEIAYDIGLTDSDYCIIDRPELSLTGETALSVRLDDLSREVTNGPLVAFSIRSLAPDGRSYGYGPCGWGLRSPQRVPVSLSQRTPRFGDVRCRPDGNIGAWCLGDGEIGHYSSGYWDVFTLPAFFEVTDWVALDESDALVRSDELQLHLSRANGVHAYLLSSGNQLFDGAGGAIPTGRERAYVSVRGYIGEFSTYHLDLAGPPRALRLPDVCQRVVQMGHTGTLAFALCETSTGEHALYRGQAERRLMSWESPIPVNADRVASISGTLGSGLIVARRDDAALVYLWEGDAFREHLLDDLIVTERPTAAVAGSAFAPFVMARSGDHLIVYDGVESSRPRTLGERVYWHGVDFPLDSELVGTELGILAISPERVVRLSRGRATLIAEHPQSLLGVRGLDSRHYLLRGPRLEAVASASTGADWYQHSWRGDPLQPFDLAVSRSGSMYVSGVIDDPTSSTGRRTTLRRLGEESVALRPPDLAFSSPPRIAADGLGRLYTVSDRHVRWYAPALDQWSPRLPLPGEVTHLVGLEEGALLVMTTDEGTRMMRCNEMCLNLEVPAAVAQPVNSAMAHGRGFCVGVQSRALWCREGRDDQWIELHFTPELARRYSLTDQDAWRVIDAVQADDDSWLVAIESDHDGFIARVVDGELARLLATGIRWGEGAVLIRDPTGRTLVGIETGGPVRIRIGSERVAIPGVLY